MGNIYNLKTDKELARLQRRLEKKKKLLSKQTTYAGNFDQQKKLLKKGLVKFSNPTDFRKNRIKALKMVLNLIPLAEEVYRKKPGQSSCYSLSNLINQAQELMGELERSLDFNQISVEVYNTTIVPFFEEIIKELGRVIKGTLTSLDKKFSSTRNRRIIDKYLKKMYREFALLFEDKVKEFKENFEKQITKYGK